MHFGKSQTCKSTLNSTVRIYHRTQKVDRVLSVRLERKSLLLQVRLESRGYCPQALWLGTLTPTRGDMGTVAHKIWPPINELQITYNAPTTKIKPISIIVTTLYL